MVKAGLPAPQCPVVEESHSSVARLRPDATTSHEFPFLSWYALRAGRCPVRALKGISGAPTSCENVLLVRNMGGPTRRESHGPGVLVCVFHGILPPIPQESCHPIHRKVATDSTAKLPPHSGQHFHRSSERSDAEWSRHTLMSSLLSIAVHIAPPLFYLMTSACRGKLP